MHPYIQGLLLYTIVFSIWDFCTNKYYIESWKTTPCIDKFKLIGLLLFHNILYYLIYFTVFFIHKYYKTIPSTYILSYILLVVSVKLNWLSNNNQCWFTKKQNELLNIDTRTGFRDFYTIIFNTYPQGAGTGTTRDMIYNSYIMGSFSYSVYLYLKKTQ